MGIAMEDGKFVSKAGGRSGAPEKKPKYPYKLSQYDSLLKIAEEDGLPIGEKKASQTATVNTMVEIIIDSFISSRSQTGQIEKGKKQK